MLENLKINFSALKNQKYNLIGNLDKTKDIKDKIDKLKNIFVTEIKIKVYIKILS